jgi:transcriptional regulator with XRE-family HTH domain
MSRSLSDGSAKTGSERLARLIRGRREQLGMSRQDLADATGVPYPTIAQIETAYRGVSPSRLATIARALGLDPAQLYDALASDTPLAAGKSTRRTRSTSRARGDSEWLPNPAYAPPSAAAAADPALTDPAPADPVQPPMEAAPLARDLVEHVVALLSELPPHERLDALGRVQSRLLSGLVQEEVRRATERPQAGTRPGGHPGAA